MAKNKKLNSKKPKTGKSKKIVSSKRQSRQPRDIMGAPVAYSLSVRNSQPNIGKVVVKHKEYLANSLVSTGTGFRIVLSQAINPGLSFLFPWCCNIGACYEMYRYRKIDFVYRGGCSTSTAGQVYMAFDNDVLDGPPTTIQDFCQTAVSAYSNVWTSQLRLSVPKNMLNKLLYTRLDSNNMANKDQKTYDIGAFYIATDLVSGAGIGLGVVSIEYEVEFMIPQPRTAADNGESIAITSSAASGVTNVDVNGSADLFTPTVGGDTLSILKPGTYRVFASNAGNSTVPTATFTPVGNAVQTAVSNAQGGSSAATVFDLVVSGVVTASLAKLANTKWTFSKLY